MNVFQGSGGPQPVYNAVDTPGVNPWGSPYPSGTWRNPAPPPPAKSYSTGPPKRASYSTSPPAPAPPPDPWAGVPGAVRDQANSITDKFLATLGYPLGYDANALAIKLAKSGTNITGSSFDAYEWLWMHGVDYHTAQNAPWSEFGMDKDSYNQVVSTMNYVYASWTGNNFDAVTLKDAIRGSWDPNKIRNFAMFGNPEGTGELLPDAQLSGSMPWLSQGQTFQQAEQGFEAFEGHTPTDRATLGAWFRFGVSAKTLGAGAQAVATAPTKPLLAGSEVR